MSDNKRIWDSFKHTDPKFTKAFNKFGRDLTTTDPMYQVMKMTDQFGPVGSGWTYDVQYTYTDKNVFAELKLGWREDTAIDATQDDNGHQQRWQCEPGSLSKFGGKVFGRLGQQQILPVSEHDIVYHA